MLDDLIAYVPGQKIDNVRIDFRRCGEGPAFGFFASQNLRDLIRELPIDAAIVFAGECLPFGDSVHMPAADSGIANGKSSSLVRHFIEQFTVRIGDIEGLHEFQAGSARGRFIYSISFETAAVGNDDE